MGMMISTDPMGMVQAGKVGSEFLFGRWFDQARISVTTRAGSTPVSFWSKP